VLIPLISCVCPVDRLEAILAKRDAIQHAEADDTDIQPAGDDDPDWESPRAKAWTACGVEYYNELVRCSGYFDLRGLQLWATNGPMLLGTIVAVNPNEPFNPVLEPPYEGDESNDNLLTILTWGFLVHPDDPEDSLSNFDAYTVAALRKAPPAGDFWRGAAAARSAT
jgi:hypothetical protein